MGYPFFGKFVVVGEMLAVKYTIPGGGVLSVPGLRHDSRKPLIIIAIHDESAGLNPYHGDRVGQLGSLVSQCFVILSIHNPVISVPLYPTEMVGTTHHVLHWFQA